MGKPIKMKCASCHKAFKTTKSSQLFCDDCERKRRLEKASAQQVVARPNAQATPAGSARPSWLDGGVATRSTEQAGPPLAPVTTAPAPAVVRAKSSAAAPPPAARPQRVVAPKPKKEFKATPKPPPPTPEVVAAIEQRYRALAQPEFDGIRTQIAQEFALPKSIVKAIVADLCKREHLPSWWDLQTYQGSPEDLERIKVAYLPYLPVPPVGVHRMLAAELQLPPATIYHGIRAVRQSLGLPAFNSPTLHEPSTTDEPEQQPVATTVAPTIPV